MPETKELAPQSEENAARLEKTSHAGIIRIGFEGNSQPHHSWSTPVSIARLKHPARALGKLTKRQTSSMSCRKMRDRALSIAYLRAAFVGEVRTSTPRAERLALPPDAWAAMAAIEAPERTCNIACCALAQTGCAGQRAFLEHDRP